MHIPVQQNIEVHAEKFNCNVLTGFGNNMHANKSNIHIILFLVKFLFSLLCKNTQLLYNSKNSIVILN